MPSFRAPYEDPFDIDYVRQPWGVEKVKTMEVRVHRRHELRLMAEGLPLYYCGYAKGDAQSESQEQSVERKVEEMKVRPTWWGNNYYHDSYGPQNGEFKSANAGTHSAPKVKI